MAEKEEQLHDVPQLQPPAPQMITPAPKVGVANMVPFSTSGGLAPNTFQEAWSFAKVLSESTIVPDLFRGQQGNCFVALEYAANLKVSPVFLMNNLMFVNGRSSLWGDIMLAIVMRHPDYQDHKEYIQGEGEDRMGVFEIQRRGHELHVITFSVKDAKLAKLWMNDKKDPWCKYPDRMLKMRARGFALRDKFPDALYGLITREEAEDMPAPREREYVRRQPVDVDNNESWSALKDEVSSLLRDNVKTDSAGNRWNTARTRAKVESFKTEAELEDYRDSLIERIKQNEPRTNERVVVQPEDSQQYEEFLIECVEAKVQATYTGNKVLVSHPTFGNHDFAPGENIPPKYQKHADDYLKLLQQKTAPTTEQSEQTEKQTPKKPTMEDLQRAKKNSAAYLKVIEEIADIMGALPTGVTSLKEFDSSTPEKQLDIIKNAEAYRDKVKADKTKAEEPKPETKQESKPAKKTEPKPEPKVDQVHGKDLFGNEGKK